MHAISVTAQSLTGPPIQTILLDEEHLASLKPDENCVFVQFPTILNGYVLNRPLGEVAGEGPIWLPIGSEIVRVPIFRYDIFSSDHDAIAMAGMMMLLQLMERERQAAMHNVRQRIMLRKSVGSQQKLYLGLISVQ